MNGFLTLLLIAASVGVGTSAETAASQVLLADFEGSTWTKSWTFSNGPEFPGATGSISEGPGHNGNGAVLNFKFSCTEGKSCGAYVAAGWMLPQPLGVDTSSALALWVAAPPQIKFVIRLRDQSGQTLQYDPLVTRLENAASEWHEVILPQWEKPEGHWGGLNNGVVNGEVVGISFMAGNRFGKSSEGQVKFDDLMLLRLEPQPVELSSLPGGLTAPLGSQELAPLLGVAVHDMHDADGLDMAKQAGFTFVRRDLVWSTAEKDGHFNFAEYDQFLAELRKRGMGVLWILGYGHPDHDLHSQEGVTAFARYASSAVAHFQGPGVRFEIWNEPDGKSLGDVSTYEAILRTALHAIRRVDEQALITSGGSWLTRLNFIDSLLASGAANGANAIAVHPYRNKPETVADELNVLRGILSVQALGSLPIWDTEWGYSSYPTQWGRSADPNSRKISGQSEEGQRRQAILGLREFLSGWASGFPMIVWYDLRDDNNSPFDEEGNYGLLNRGGIPKSGYTAVETLSKFAKGRRYIGMVPDLPFGAHAMRLDGGNDLVLVVWDDEPRLPHEVHLAKQDLVSVTDLVGRNVQLDEAASDKVTLKLAEETGPVYIRYRKQ